MVQASLRPVAPVLSRVEPWPWYTLNMAPHHRTIAPDGRDYASPLSRLHIPTVATTHPHYLGSDPQLGISRSSVGSTGQRVGIGSLEGDERIRKSKPGPSER